MDNYSSKYDDFIILGDFNSEATESDNNNCFKNPENPSCIDLIITNRLKCFQNSVTLETGLSDFLELDIFKTALNEVKDTLQ